MKLLTGTRGLAGYRRGHPGTGTPQGHGGSLGGEGSYMTSSILLHYWHPDLQRPCDNLLQDSVTLLYTF